MYFVGQWLWDTKKKQPVQYLGFGLASPDDKRLTVAYCVINSDTGRLEIETTKENEPDRYHEMYAKGEYKEILGL